MSLKWENLKNSGNEEFRRRNYQAAISLYSDAISNDHF